MDRGKITRKLICKQSADVCKTIHKSVVAGNEPCYNDVDFYGETFRLENENKNCVQIQDLKRLKYAYYIILDMQKERRL